MSDPRPIGIFDSGVGGLTVVNEIQKILPLENLVYFGDTARVPYGTKSKDTITKFSVENVQFLMEHDVKLVVVACNTASSLSLDFLKRCFKVPIVGVIEPGVKCAISSTRNKRIGVIGTHATIASNAYEKMIRRINDRIVVFSQSCPLFVPLVEENWLDRDVTVEIASIYLRPLRSKKIDTLILGCTHYPLLRTTISRIMGSSVVLIDSAREVARVAKEILDAGGLLNRTADGRYHKFFVSDQPERFVETGRRFLKRRISCVRRAM